MNKQELSLQINEIIPRSRANGPGIRYTIWMQGCSLNCKECINPEMHNPLLGRDITISTLIADILNQSDISGITLTGGEPIDQLENLVFFIEQIKKYNLDIILLTGYDLEELVQLSLFKKLKSHIDVIIAGRYEEKKRIAKGLRGSSNKKYFFFTDKYTIDDLENTPLAEIIIDKNKKLISGSFIDIFVE